LHPSLTFIFSNMHGNIVENILGSKKNGLERQFVTLAIEAYALF